MESLKRVDGNVSAFNEFIPNVNSILYQADVEVIGKHLSGLLLIKKMPDSSRRVVFSNEMGLTYFDLAFKNGGAFECIYAIRQMNRKAVIKTLQKDFSLMLMDNLNYANAYLSSDSLNRLYVFPDGDYRRIYATDMSNSHIIRAEAGSVKKIIVKEYFFNVVNNIPDSVAVVHQNFNFTIGLKRLIR